MAVLEMVSFEMEERNLRVNEGLARGDVRE
jgi:hypothetical protein